MAKKFVLTEEEKQELYDYFISLTGNVKTFDLTKPKNEIALDFYKRIFKNDFSSYKNLATSIFKSYTKLGDAQKAEMEDFVDFEYLKLKKPNEIIEKFLNDFVLTEKVANLKKNEDLETAFANGLAERLEDIFGSQMFVDVDTLNNISLVTFKSKLLSKLQNDGYHFDKNVPELMTNENLNKKSTKNSQQFVLDNYVNFVNKYVRDYGDHLKPLSKEKDYDDYWTKIKSYCNYLDGLLTEQTKQNPSYLKAQTLLDEFYSKEIDYIKKNRTKFGKFGEYLSGVFASAVNLKNNKASEEDMANINSFLQKVKHMNQDIMEGDNPNPVVYFYYFKVSPLVCMQVVKKLIESEKKLPKEQVKELRDASKYLNMSFRANVGLETMDVVDVRSTLNNKYRNFSTQSSTHKMDMTIDGNFDKFVQNVEKAIADYDLPKNELCISALAKRISFGKKPLDLHHETEIAKQ